ncbi:hypothetical protein niasHS_017184 [Heterodera schachtii]|uniref:Uncharacterized protein n=1 Tax=Heterodera schachtii TaxID=97005 RepID=A0ABD2I0I2_HETSC
MNTNFLALFFCCLLLVAEINGKIYSSMQLDILDWSKKQTHNCTSSTPQINKKIYNDGEGRLDGSQTDKCLTIRNGFFAGKNGIDGIQKLVSAAVGPRRQALTQQKKTGHGRTRRGKGSHWLFAVRLAYAQFIALKLSSNNKLHMFFRLRPAANLLYTCLTYSPIMTRLILCFAVADPTA